MELIGIITEDKVHPGLSYVVDVLNKHPMVVESCIRFQLGKVKEKSIAYGTKQGTCNFLIPGANYIFQDKGHKPVINKFSFHEELIYSIEKDKSEHRQFYVDGVFGFDIFEMIFFHLARYEERFLKQGDYLNNKFEFEKQLLLVDSGLEKIPVVDKVIQSFLEILTERKIEIEKPIVLSHDIDSIQKFKSSLSIFRKIVGHFYHRKGIKGINFLLENYFDFLFRGKDSYDNFEWLLSSRKIEKSIYFLVGGNTIQDTPINLSSPIFLNAYKKAESLGYNIGIHPSFASWRDKNMIKAEKEKLENAINGEVTISRQHFLNFDISETPQLLLDCNIYEDSSLGYTRYIGYRCGTAFPYNLYDFKEEKTLNLLEKPLNFMDVSWLYESLRENSFEFDKKVDLISGGFNFHNTFFDEARQRNLGITSLYEKYFL